MVTAKHISLLVRENVYRLQEDEQVEKLNCVGHVQKRLGTALRNLKVQYQSVKLVDGKKLVVQGNSQIHWSIQIIMSMRFEENLNQMIRAVQATLLHSNSSDETPRHHLCPTWKDSWCKWQQAKAQDVEYHHTKPPIPEAIVHILKPIHARLGNFWRSALQGTHRMLMRVYIGNFVPKNSSWERRV